MTKVDFTEGLRIGGEIHDLPLPRLSLPFSNLPQFCLLYLLAWFLVFSQLAFRHAELFSNHCVLSSQTSTPKPSEWLNKSKGLALSRTHLPQRALGMSSAIVLFIAAMMNIFKVVPSEEVTPFCLYSLPIVVNYHQISFLYPFPSRTGSSLLRTLWILEEEFIFMILRLKRHEVRTQETIQLKEVQRKYVL